MRRNLLGAPKMHVVLVTELYLPGANGVVTAVRNLAEGLRRAGQEVTLVAPASTAASSWATRNGIKLHPVRGVTLPARIQQRAALWTPGEVGTVRALLRAADIVHLHSPFVTGLAVGRLALEEQIPIVVTNHALPENIICSLRIPVTVGLRLFGSFLWRLIEKGIKIANLITSPTEYAARTLISRFGKLDITIISNGVICSGNPIKMHAIGQDNEPLRALYVGRLQREKRVDELLQAVAACTNFGIPLNLTIVGAGPDETRLMNITKNKKLQGNVFFAGQVDDCTRDDLYDKSHFLWMASRAELQCCAALEAMASGRPVIAANAGALPEIVLDGYSGRLYAPGDVRQIVEIMKEFKRNPELYDSLSRGAQLTAAKHNLSSVCESTLDAYSSLFKV